MQGKKKTFVAVMSLMVAGAWGVGEAEPVRYGQVILPAGQALHVEIADSPMRRQLGYMFREQVGPEDGMIFLFEEAEFHSFWMKNVTIPLDILWIAGDGTVVDVSLQTPACAEDPCPSYRPMGRALYVLELAGGRAKKLGIHPGQTLQILLPEAPAPRKP
jgi:uncharacterized membrane protein (UPF0127 family)